MKIISHRGNISGPNIARENSPEYIDEALDLGYDVEIDVWYKNDNFYLGHDMAIYKIHIVWLLNRASKLWVHCKNTEVLDILLRYQMIHCFWHQTDDVTITSKKYVWAYPGKQPIYNSIAVLPELKDDDISQCLGVCTDNPKFFEANYA